MQRQRPASVLSPAEAAFQQACKELERLAPTIPARIAAFTQLDLDDLLDSTSKKAVQDSLTLAAQDTRTNTIDPQALGAKGAVEGSEYFVGKGFHVIKLLAIVEGKRVATREGGKDVYVLGVKRFNWDDPHPILPPVELAIAEKRLIKHCINVWIEKKTGGSRVSIAALHQFLLSALGAFSLPYIQNQILANTLRDRGRSEVIVRAPENQRDFRYWAERQINLGVISQAELPLPFFSYRVDPTKHPLIYPSFETAPDATRTEILSEFVSAFVHHPRRLSHGRAGNIMMRKGVLPPYCKNGVELSKIIQIVLDVRTRATTTADAIDSESEDEGGINDQDRPRQRKRRNQFALHEPSELGDDRRGWAVSSGNSQKGSIMEMSLNAKGAEICLAQEAQQRPYSIPALVPAVATHPVLVRNETIMRNPVYYFTIHNLSLDQRKLVTKAIYATMTVSRRATLKTCSNLCCDLSISKEVALPPAEDYFESPFASKDPLCLHCVWCASLVQADGQTEETFYASMRIPEMSTAHDQYSLGAKYNCFLRCLAGCAERYFGQPGTCHTDGDLTGYSLPFVCHPCGRISKMVIDVAPLSKLFKKERKTQPKGTEWSVVRTALSPLSTVSGKPRTIFCTRKDCGRWIRTGGHVRGLQVHIDRYDADHKVVCKVCFGDFAYRDTFSDKLTIAIVNALVLSTTPMFALSDVAREHSIDISDILAHLDNKTAMGRILDPSLEGRLELFFEELFAL